MRVPAIGPARAIHEEVRAIPMVNEYSMDMMPRTVESREKRMKSEVRIMSKGVGICWRLGKW